MKNGERNRMKEKVKGREGMEDERVKMRKGKAEREKQKGNTQKENHKRKSHKGKNNPSWLLLFVPVFIKI